MSRVGVIVVAVVVAEVVFVVESEKEYNTHD